MESKEDVVMSVPEARSALGAWERLKAKANEIIDADGSRNDGIVGIELDSSGKCADISYWSACRGELCIENDIVPLEWFGAKSIEDLKELWRKKHDADCRAALRAERQAERRAKKRRAELRKTAAERKRKKELATLKRLKEKYPGEAV